MGKITSLARKSVYLDTNLIVYAVEGFDEHRAFLEGLFRLIDAGQTTAVTSELTLAEALVRPLEAGHDDVIKLYDNLLQNSERLGFLPIDRSILLEAARYRAELGIKLPDAIHVATAIAGNCDVFLTNDKRIKLPPGLTLHTP